MKKLLFLIIYLLSASIAFSDANEYVFTSSAGTYTALSGATEIMGANQDDVISSSQTIGFDFVYDGITYTTYKVSSNGFVNIGGNLTNSYNANNLASGTYKPVFAPLWDDMQTGSSGGIYYELSGSSPNRVLTIEFKNIKWKYGASNENRQYQVKLYETTNVIEFIFSVVDNGESSPTASIGINDATGGSGHFLSITPGATPTASSSSANNSISSNSNLTGGITYTFTPPVGPGTPTNPSPADDATGIAVNNNPDISWTNPGGTTYNEVYFSTSEADVTNKVASARVLNGSPATIYTSYNQASDLAYSTTYYWRISETDGTGTTDGTVWSFSTVCGANPPPWTQGFEGMASVGDGIVPSCMAESGDWNTANSSANYNRKARTGSNYIYTKFSADDYLYSTELTLTGGTSYDFSFWYSTDGNSGWTTVEAKYGSSQTSGGIISSIGSAISGPTNTSYAKFSGSFIPAGTGSYYVSIHVIADGNPYYICFDDLSVQETPPTWDGSSSTDWNTAANWSTGSVPTSTKDVIIANVANDPVISNITAEVNDLTIESGATLLIEDNGNLTVAGNLVNSGTFTVQSNSDGTGSLITEGSVTGSTTLQRYFAKYSGEDGSDGWHFLSSSVASQAISSFNTHNTSDDFFKWDEAAGNWDNRTEDDNSLDGSFESTFTKGRGYLVSYSSNVTKEFAGTINTTSETVNLSYSGSDVDLKGWNLVGNPFTSAIDWDNVTTSASVNDEVQVVKSSNGTYLTWVNGAGSLTDGIIPAMQGFFVKATAVGQSITMDPADREHSNTDVYKSTNVADQTMRVQVVDHSDYSDLYIRFNENATESFDASWDANKLFGFSQIAQVYAYDNENLYAVNSLSSHSETHIVNLAVKTPIAAEYHFVFMDLPQISDMYSVQLLDQASGTTIDIKEGTKYYFTSEEGNNENRFQLHFGTTGINEIIASQLHTYMSGENLCIIGEEGAAELQIFDVQGKQMFAKSVQLTDDFRQRVSLSSGVYIIRVQKNEIVKTNKVIIKK